jgi:hypothetical protein
MNNENVYVNIGLLVFFVVIFDEFYFQKIRIKSPPQASVYLQYPDFNPRGYCGAYKQFQFFFQSVVEMIVHVMKYEFNVHVSVHRKNVLICTTRNIQSSFQIK